MTDANYLPSKDLALICGEDWGPATNWYTADVYYMRRCQAYDTGSEQHPGTKPAPEGKGTIASEVWDDSPLRMWATVHWTVNPEGLRTIRLSVDEVLWTGRPGPEDALNGAPTFTIILDEGRGEYTLPSSPPHPRLVAPVKTFLKRLGIQVRVQDALAETEALIECLNIEIEQAVKAYDKAQEEANGVTAYERSCASSGGCYCSGPGHAHDCPVDSRVPRGLSRPERLDDAVAVALAHSRALHKKRAEAKARFASLKAWE